MLLGQVHLGPEWYYGYTLVDYRENLWLHSSSVISGMLALKQMYPNVGVVNPSYHDLVGLSTKKKTAAGFGALDPTNERIIAMICIDHHWVAYLLDKPSNVCYLFDPLQLKENLRIVQSSVQNVIEPLLKLQDRLTYKEITWCLQKDSSSCGIWCLVVLELLLSGTSWANSLYELLPYLRMRFLCRTR
ncbi:hypothetical protein DVH05_022173 [Phytophthora capsici]|nr:hypothetical protein DVH05_005832 [Phytophthora capsici]KAG1708545.1 hypothetical protein DVH05_022173 [Phytophthora capsici]